MQTVDSDSRLAPEAPGKLPELQAAREAAAAPIELPRVVMRGALAVAAGGLLLALVLGLWRARADMRDEIDGAVALAQAMALLAEHGRAADLPREELLASLRALQADNALRHLHLQLRDAEGRTLLPPIEEPRPELPLRWLVRLNRLLFAPPPPQVVSWPLRRADGESWQLQLQASPDSEQREALASLLEMLGLLAAGSALMLAVMFWNVRRSFRPLRPLLEAIAGIERREVAPLAALPPMPIRELAAVADALRHLAGALQQAEEERRALARQVATLQEDERSRLALELHDEFGQRLTALRVDAAWLQRRLAAEPELAAVAAGMGEQCARIQQEVRELLSRLRPPDASGEGEAETVGRLRALLEGLVAAWSQAGDRSTRYALDFETGTLADDTPLPRALVLAVYRISQEALTNVARHARAGSARLLVRIEPAGDGPAQRGGTLRWCVEDDGRGLDHPGAWQRGNGLAGVKQRVWAAGGDLEWGARDPLHADRPGLRLQARLPVDLPGAPQHGAGRLRSMPAVEDRR
jgi:two-component system sensor histidine kinase UhpB